MLFVLITSLGISTCGNDIIQVDPEVCKTNFSFIETVLPDGSKKVDLDYEKSYWFCLKQSDPNNQEFQRRVKILDYVKTAIPISVSSKDYTDIMTAKKLTDEYIKYLEDKVDSCNKSTEAL